MAPYQKQIDRFGTTSQFIFQPGKAVMDLGDFLDEKQPSTTKDHLGAHWIVVARRDIEEATPAGETLETIQSEGQKILNHLVERKAEIDADEDIPRKSTAKKNGKKKVKDEAMDKAKTKLELLAGKTSTVGYWTWFSASGRVDKIFRTLAESVMSGPLKHTAAFMVRCHTSPANVGDKYKHQIQLWLDDIYNEVDAKAVLDCCIQMHALRPSDGRSEVMRVLGLTEPDGLIDPWVHKPEEFFSTKVELKEALEEARKTAKEKLHRKRGCESDEEDELAKSPPKKKKKRGQLENGQGTLNDFMARMSSSSAPVTRPSSSQRNNLKSLSSGSSGGQQLSGTDLGQGSYRLGSGSPGASAAAAAERRQRKEKKKLAKQPSFFSDEEGAIVID